MKQKINGQNHEDVLSKIDAMKENYPYSFNGAEELYKTKDRFELIGTGEAGRLEEARFYTFTSRDYSELSALLSEISMKEEKLKNAGNNLDGIKSFNKNIWLDFSKESNAIEGIFDDFDDDLLDFRFKLRGKIASEPRTRKFDKLEYYRQMINQCSKAIEDNDCRVIKGKNVEHQLSPELIKHFLAFKYAYKCAKLDISKAQEAEAERRERLETYKSLGLSKKEIEKAERTWNRERVSREMSEFNDLILEVHSFLFDSHPLNIRNTPIYVNTAGWAPPSEDNVSEYLDNLAKWVVVDSRQGMLHPIERSAIFHVDFIHTHPFMDGNGRTGRIMSNYLLVQDEMPTISINHQNRQAYFDAINKAVETNDVDDLIGIFCDSCFDSAKHIKECLDNIEKRQTKSIERAK